MSPIRGARKDPFKDLPLSPAQIAAGIGKPMKSRKESELDKLKEQVSLHSSNGSISPIAFAKIINVRPQHIYNAIRRAAIPHIVLEGKIRVEEVVALNYVEVYLQRRHNIVR